MSGVKDWTDLGILPLQDHDPNIPSMSSRQMVVGARVTKLPMPEDGGSAALMEIGKDWGRGTIGDLHPFWFWQTRDREQRGMGMWGQAHPCIVSEFGGVQPVYGWDWKQDLRFVPAVTTIPSAFGTFPRGTVGIALHGTEDLEQQELLVHADPRLVCPSVGGPIDAATKVVDMQPDGELCVKGGKRVAPIQTMMRVVPFFGANESIGGGSLAWNCGSALGGGATHGLSWFKLDGGRSGPITPGGSSSGPITGGPTGGPIRPSGPITGVPSFQPGDVVKSALGPPSGDPTEVQAAGLEDDGPGFGAGFPEGFSPDEFGVFAPSPEKGHGTACMARIPTFGPFHGGHTMDKHHLLDDADGNPLNSGHISTDAYYYRNREKDGPMLFEGSYPNPGPQPLKARVHLTWDPDNAHAGMGSGEMKGHWRWYSEYHVVVPTGSPGVPKQPPPTGGMSRMSGPGTGNPGKPASPGPGRPMGGTPGPTTGGPPGPGAPLPGGGGSLGHPITPNPSYPGGGRRFPGYPITGGAPPGPTAPIPGLPVAPGKRGGSSGRPVNPGGPIKPPGPGPGQGGGGGKAEHPLDDQPTEPREDYGDWDPYDFIEESAGRKKPQDPPTWFPPHRPSPTAGGAGAANPDEIIGPGFWDHLELPSTKVGWRQHANTRSLITSIEQLNHQGPGMPVMKQGGFDDPDGWSPSEENKQMIGAVSTIGELNGAQHVYALHHPMMETFSSLAMRPQLTIKGYPNFEHDPLQSGVMITNDEMARPQSVAIRAWGAQADGDWDYLQGGTNGSSRARGGVVQGGLIVAPPEFELEDYYGINSDLDVDASVSQPIMLFAPGTRIAFGKPTSDGGMTNGTGWHFQQSTAGNRPLVVTFTPDGSAAHTDLMTMNYDSNGEYHVDFEGSNAIRVPYGRTLTRPSSPVGGMMRMLDNAVGTRDELEYYDEQTTTWKQLLVSGTNDVEELLMSTDRITGRTTAGTGAVEELTVGDGLALSAGELAAAPLLASMARLSPAKFDMFYAFSSTEITSLASSSVGRDLLVAADAEAVRVIADAQQLDSDLTAIAALTTTSYGRGVLETTSTSDAQEWIGINSEVAHTHYADFFSANPDCNGWQLSSTGAGAGSRQFWEWVVSSNENIGVLELGTGTTSSGWISLHVGANVFRCGSAIYTYAARLDFKALSTASDEYTCTVGFSNDVFSGGFGGSEVSFRYDRATDGVNWHCITRNGGTETKTDSGVAVTASTVGDNMQTLSLTVNEAATSVTFTIDEVDVAVITTNIPTSRVGHFIQLEATAYTSVEPICGIDWTRFELSRSTAR
jgi:hypothetical protein